jgi:hypothetical protein
LIGDIVQYRRSLGLDDVPPELVAKLRENASWRGPIPQFQNDLPVKDISYGAYTQQVLGEVFGKEYPRLVRGCKSDPTVTTIPGRLVFDADSRFCIFPEDEHQIPIEGFLDYILHEAIGHGPDPATSTTKYPNEILVRVEHGKWLALTQLLSIPGEFLNNPGDKIYPLLKKQLGKSVGLTITTSGDLGQILVGGDERKITSELITIAGEQHIDLKYLKFNKSTCKRIGTLLAQSMRSGGLTFKGDLHETYASFMENMVTGETFAEMMKYALRYPERVNTTVIRGVTEVIQAINGNNINVDGIRSKILHPTGEIIERNLSEDKVIKSIVNPTEKPAIAEQAIPALSVRENAIIKLQQVQSDIRETAFDKFVQSGEIPGTLHISPKQLLLIKQFAVQYSEYVRKYPGIQNIDIINDDSFDPNMNLWDIEKLGFALDPAFVRGLVAADNIPESMNLYLVAKSQALEDLQYVPLSPKLPTNLR